MSRFDRELQKLECSINYRKSNKKERSQINGWDMVAEIMKFVFTQGFDKLRFVDSGCKLERSFWVYMTF